MTPHNSAAKGDIAPVVLMPGDPLRAKFIAGKYLEQPRLVSSVRNMLAYTGFYKGVELTIMGSGMGMPSIGIYSWELFNEYDVQAIIRIGSAGSYTDDLNLYDVILVEECFSESTYAQVTSEDMDNFQRPNPELNALIEKEAKVLDIPLTLATIHSSDVFYHNGGNRPQQAIAKGCQAVEMESFALFHNARVLNKKAACLLTISDSAIHPGIAMSADDREKSLDQMIVLALDSAAVYAKEHLA